MHKTRWWISFSHRVGVQTLLMMHGAGVCERGAHDQHSIAQLDQKKICRPFFLHPRAQRESKGSSPLNCSAWIHTSGHAHLHTSLINAYATSIPKLKALEVWNVFGKSDKTMRNRVLGGQCFPAICGLPSLDNVVLTSSLQAKALRPKLQLNCCYFISRLDLYG